MKKKMSILLVILLMSSIRSVYATTYHNFLPGGKNYLDESNFVVSNNSINTDNSFLVKDSTFYTLSFPGSDRIGSSITVEIMGNEIYFNGNVSSDPYCTFTEQESNCTFETVPGEDYISVSIGASDIGNYYNYYGFYGFQLEEGTTPSSYEEYIAPDVDEDDPEFSGSGAYIKSYHTYETVQNIIDEHLSVIDEVEGDISNNIMIISDTYTGNENIVGDYLVELTASDSSGNTAYFNLSILVKDEVPPIITGPSSVEYNVFEAPSLMSIINDAYLIEDEYSNTTINILVDNYTLEKDIIGTYTVNFEVVDESLNSTTQAFQIVVVDNEVPTVLSDLSIDSYLSDPYDLDDVLNTLEFSDNYTDMSGANVIVISNEFIGNESNPGTYIINIEVNDESGNILDINLTVKVIDDVSPQIGGPLTYEESYTEELVLNDFLNMMSVSDNVNDVSLNDVYIIEDTYSNRSSITGSYLISFGISDENSNESVHTINITLFDDVAPIIYVDNYIVTVDMSSTFTTDDAVTLLINSEELIEGNYSVRTLFDEYTGNETVEGTYLYMLEFTNSDGESYEKEFVVKVINDDSDSD
jgi:hypothetical protein